MDPKTLQTWLPLAIVAVVMALRWKSMSRPRPLRLAFLIIAPVVVLMAAALLIVAQPPSALGWLALAGGLAIGALLGWQRARLLHFERDTVTNKLQYRQTPAALFLIIGLIVAKRLILPQPGTAPVGKDAAMALVMTDGLLGFALGMVIAANLTMWLRSRYIPHHDLEG